MTETITYDRAEVIRAIRQVDAVVVSLDRVGSFIADLPEDQQAKASIQFLVDFKVAAKLAEARRILSSAFSPELGSDDMDELERELQGNDYWSAK